MPRFLVEADLRPISVVVVADSSDAAIDEAMTVVVNDGLDPIDDATWQVRELDDDEVAS